MQKRNKTNTLRTVAEETNTEYRNNRGHVTGASDYRLIAAQQDPLVNAGADFLSDKTGMDRNAAVLAALLAQKLMGMQNGGATLGGTIQSGIQMGGAPAYMQGGNYSGSISGSNVMALEIARSMTQNVQSSFFKSNGAARHSAYGMNQGEIAGVMGQVMRGGSQYSFGPLFQTEALTQDRIEQLRSKAVKSGDTAALGRLKGIEVGSLYTSENDDNMRKFEAFTQKAVKVVSNLKNMLGSPSMKELDAKIQATLGMSLPEFGLDNADRLFKKANNVARTVFGGSTENAMAWMLQGSRTVTGSIAGRLGLDPSSMGMLQGVGAAVSGTDSFSGIYGGMEQTRNAGYLRGQGFDVKASTAAEIQAVRSRNKGAYVSQEKEVLALSSYLQQAGSNINKDDKADIHAALQGISDAGTAEEVIRARGLAASVFQRVSGGRSVGGFVGNAENHARLLGNLRGESLSVYGNTIGGMAGSREQAFLKDGYAQASGLKRRLGMTNSGDMETLGVGIANMTNAQIQDLANAAESGEFSGVAADKEMSLMLKRLGVDPKKFFELAKGMDRGDINDVYAQRNMFDGTQGFVGDGTIQKGAKDELQALLSVTQSGPAHARGDAISEAIAGFVGDQPVRGGALVKIAEEAGKRVNRVQLDKQGNLVVNKTNMEALRNSEDGAAFLAANKIESQAGLQKYLDGGGSVAHLNAIQALTKGGASRTTQNADGSQTLSFLDESQAKDARNAMNAEVWKTSLEALGGKVKTGDVLRGEDETVEEYDTRMKALAQDAFTTLSDKKGGLSGAINYAGKGGKDNKKFADKLKVLAPNLTDEQKEKALDAIEERMQNVQTEMQEKDDKGLLTEPFKESYRAESKRLQELANAVRGNVSEERVGIIKTTVIKADKIEAPPRSPKE